MRLLVVQRLVGALVALSGVIMLPPAAISAWYADGIVSAFLDSALACAVVGGLMWLPVRRARHELRVRDGFLVTVATWVMVCLACALPFMLGPTKLPLSQAVFESVSGLTTTGVTVLVGLDRLPASLLFYRQSLCFIGGMGIVIIAVAIVPMLRIGGSQLFRAEASSGMKDTRLTPRIAGTARDITRTREADAPVFVPSLNLTLQPSTVTVLRSSLTGTVFVDSERSGSGAYFASTTSTRRSCASAGSTGASRSWACRK